jgi:NTP pyrophosphatase (non-canonical NTP hydrolase)
MKHFNKLQPSEAEALSVLAEECSEVIKIVMKIQRHGLLSYHPRTNEQNTEALGREIGDVLAAIKLLQYNAPEPEYSPKKLEKLCEEKLISIQEYLHHAKVPA